MKEVSAHELGHTLDNTAGVLSSSAEYINAQYSDFFHLDHLSDNGGPSSPRRDPCVANGSTPAPYAGAVNEITGAAICLGAVLNPAYTTNGIPWTNSKIAQAASPLIPPPAELYAQQLALNLFVTGNLTQPQVLSKTIDILVAFNGYLPCTASWASMRATGSFAKPAATGVCAPSPAWYVPGQP